MMWMPKPIASRTFKSLRESPRLNKTTLLTAIIAFGIVGGIFLLISHAATPTASTEPENGALSGSASIVNDGNASGGKAILFGTSLPNALSPAHEDSVWTARFDRRNQPRGWIGGDGGASVQLPDGRVLFMWADTFIGNVKTDGSYAPFYQFIHNSLTTMSAQGANFTTYTKGSTNSESAYIPNVAAHPNNSLWPYGGVVDNNKLYLLANEWQQDPNGAFGSSFTGNTWLVQLALPTLAIESTTQVMSNDQTQWGAATYEDANYTYIFGHLSGATYLYRVPRGQLSAAAQYKSASGWSTDRHAATQISDQDLEAVQQVGGEFKALYLTTLFPKVVSQAHAPSPEGPWTALPDTVFDMPESHISGLFQYMPRIHLELSDKTGFLMSYSNNTYGPLSDVVAHAPYYQPHFFRGPTAP
jgi:hypothetical protein